MTAPRWRYVSAAEAEATTLISRGIYHGGTLRMIVTRAPEGHDATNAFGRQVADLLNITQDAEETIRMKDHGSVV